jgi:hypothetical protein
MALPLINDVIILLIDHFISDIKDKLNFIETCKTVHNCYTNPALQCVFKKWQSGLESTKCTLILKEPEQKIDLELRVDESSLDFTHDTKHTTYIDIERFSTQKEQDLYDKFIKEKTKNDDMHQFSCKLVYDIGLYFHNRIDNPNFKSTRWIYYSLEFGSWYYSGDSIFVSHKQKDRFYKLVGFEKTEFNASFYDQMKDWTIQWLESRLCNNSTIINYFGTRICIGFKMYESEMPLASTPSKKRKRVWFDYCERRHYNKKFKAGTLLDHVNI